MALAGRASEEVHFGAVSTVAHVGLITPPPPVERTVGRVIQNPTARKVRVRDGVDFEWEGLERVVIVVIGGGGTVEAD